MRRALRAPNLSQGRAANRLRCGGPSPVSSLSGAVAYLLVRRLRAAPTGRATVIPDPRRCSSARVRCRSTGLDAAGAGCGHGLVLLRRPIRVKRLVFQRSGRVFGLGPRRGSGGLPLHQVHCCRNFCNCSGLIAWIAALCVLSGMEASQALENGISDIRNINLDRVVVLVLRLEEAEVAPQIDQGGALVVQLECRRAPGPARKRWTGRRSRSAARRQYRAAAAPGRLRGP